MPVLFSLDIFTIEPNFITKDIALKLNVFIINLLLKFLSAIKIFQGNNH